MPRIRDTQDQIFRRFTEMGKPYYQRAGISIYHGDCREILPLLPKVGLLLTDPPYSTGRDDGECRGTGNIAVSLHLASEHAERALVFSGSSNRSIEFVKSSIRKPQHNRILCWHKPRSRSVAVGPWDWDVILIHYFGKSLPHSAHLSSMIPSANEKNTTGHRRAVPVDVFDHLYRAFAPCSVLDPFLGSGSSLISVAKHGGTGIGIEIEEKYCALAAHRLRDLQL